MDCFSTALEDEEKELGAGNGWVLGGDDKGNPTLLDAALFAYTHLLLDESMGWKDKRLMRSVERWGPLKRHHDRIMREFYADVEMKR